MKRRYKLILAAAVLAIIPIFMYSGRIYTIATLSGRANVPSGSADFSAFVKCLAVTDVNEVAYFYGLPHPYWHADAFTTSVMLDDYISVVGYPFYSAAINTQSNDLTEVVSKVIDARSYLQYGGPSLCGGYHADLAVRVDHKNGRSWFLFCFGCHEIILVNESGDSYIAEISDPLYSYMHSFFKGLPKPTTYQD
jgi:hypothetical protein